MLLIPAEVKRLINKGRREGRREVRTERDRRYKEAYERFGVEVGGVVMLPRTPEVQEFLDGETGETGA